VRYVSFGIHRMVNIIYKTQAVLVRTTLSITKGHQSPGSLRRHQAVVRNLVFVSRKQRSNPSQDRSFFATLSSGVRRRGEDSIGHSAEG
jgi:hypothetical protein